MSTTNGGQNGGATPQAPQQAAGDAPQLAVLGQYVRDLSFENPTGPRGPQSSPNQPPAIDVQVGVSTHQLSGTDVEVVLRIEGKAVLPDNMVVFAFELDYGGVFRILNIPPESMQPVMLIECPRLLFPFARQIISTTVANGGFPPLLLDPVDFAGLYRQNLARQQAAGSPPAQA
jgi:preprotein translocase subunit SecB